jgi:DNA-binding CsgD family transcriptional regulator
LAVAWQTGRRLDTREAIAYGLEPDAITKLDAPVPPSGLSARELDVLRLLAEGRTNREIAATLGISHYTVANHVRNMMNKLGLESRTAVVAWAMRHGLA